LPRGDRLLSFEVGYYWHACPAHGRCAAAADSTAAPFAARRYAVGHADTGLRLQITETATEVGQTSSAAFSVSIKRASGSRTTRAAGRAYGAGRRPATEFVNGTPQRRTGSAEEYFSVDPPHFSAANGPVTQRYRVDSGPWRPLPGSRVFYTGKLRTGRHRVAVRTARRAGATAARFGWRGVPLPAPLACRPAAHRQCWDPPHLAARPRPMRRDGPTRRTLP